jgi:hypothetical protein
LFAANACVAAIKEGCELYKQAKESFVQVKSTVDEAIGVANEVRGFWNKLDNFFSDNKPAPKPVAQKKKAKFVSVDETKVMADVVKQLTEFFRIQEQLAAHIRAEEEKSRNVYDPDANLMESALNRVMALDQMAALEVTIRETMVYQSPPEMGALYSKVFEMRDTIKQEQEQARLAQEAKERYKQWQLRQAQAKLKAQALYLVITAVLLIYLYLWFAILVQWRKAKWGF